MGHHKAQPLSPESASYFASMFIKSCNNFTQHYFTRQNMFIDLQSFNVFLKFTNFLLKLVTLIQDIFTGTLDSG